MATAIDVGNPWRWWYEDDPGLQYQMARPQTGSPSFVDYFRQPGAEARVFGDFDTAQARLAAQGLAPNIKSIDFLNDYPFWTEYTRLGPTQRGDTPSVRFAPPGSFRITAGF